MPGETLAELRISLAAASEEAARESEATQREYGQRYDLRPPDPGKEFILDTDSCDYSIGACLAQQDIASKESPVACLSRKLGPAQTRWATVEREAYAIIWVRAKLEAWLFGARVRIITDHNELKFLTLTTPQSARLTCWALALQKYNLVVEHKKGASRR
ncbi:hypothetical protein HPB50_012439 [Hyalomma asiaticum]|uniref:Uncharacterized protein n=1 Tax=Hyalomma asiaticum TaxID=266040 RepID=A0ACB7S281_HYAAI|nr:hypothetical protein HPB50_012439 [Hyalomma asiaticum]